MIIDTEIQIQAYFNKCELDQSRPTKQGLAKYLGISNKTLEHVNTGYYRTGKPYTPTPHTTRVFDNADFEIVQTACKRIEQY